MKNLFEEFYPYESDELKQFVNTATVVVDANVLLHIYRYSPDAADQLVSILKALEKRLWMPHQVAAEFHANRVKVIVDQAKAYDDILKSLATIQNEATKSLGGSDRHPFIRRSDLLKAIAGPIEAEVRAVTKLQKDHDARSSKITSVDARWKALVALYDSNVGTAYGADELLDKHQQAETRYLNQIPPGFRDADKSLPEKYGDFIVWSQMLDHFEEMPNDVVFVTDDQKDDWWRIVSGKTLGPHPALRREFFERTGKRIHFYTSDEFVRHFASSLKIQLDEQTKQEVERVSSAGADASRTSNDSEAVRPRYWATGPEKTRLLSTMLRYASHREAEVGPEVGRLESLDAVGLRQLLARLNNLRQEASWLEVHIARDRGSGLNVEHQVESLSRTLSEVAATEREITRRLFSFMSSDAGGSIVAETLPPSLLREAAEALLASSAGKDNV